MRAALFAICLLFTAGADAQTLKVAVLGDPAVPDFASAQTPTEQLIATALWSSLVRLDEAGAPEPDLAAYWDISEDGLVYRFRLKDGLRWSDGSSITTQSFLNSLSALPLMEASVDAGDVISVTLTQARADLLRDLADPALGPEPPRANLYSGPFVVDQRTETQLDLRPNAFAVTPARGSVSLIRTDTLDTALALFDTGSAHLIPAEVEQSGTTETGTRITAVTVNYEATDVGGVPGLDVRHALSMSIDREIMLESLGLGMARSQTTPLPDGLLLGGSYPVPFEGLPYTARDGVAEALLSVAGFEEETALNVTLLLPYVDRLIRTAEWLRREWESIGISVTTETLPAPEFERRLADGAFQLALRDIAPLPEDAAAHLAPFRRSAGPANVARYAVQEFDDVYAYAESAPDAAVRRRRHRDSEKELIEDQIRIALYAAPARWRLARDVRGWPDKPIGLPPLETLWLAP